MTHPCPGLAHRLPNRVCLHRRSARSARSTLTSSPRIRHGRRRLPHRDHRHLRPPHRSRRTRPGRTRSNFPPPGAKPSTSASDGRHAVSSNSATTHSRSGRRSVPSPPNSPDCRPRDIPAFGRDPGGAEGVFRLRVRYLVRTHADVRRTHPHEGIRRHCCRWLSGNMSHPSSRAVLRRVIGCPLARASGHRPAATRTTPGSAWRRFISRRTAPSR